MAIGPSPEMVALLQQYGCGVVSDSFEPKRLAAVIQQLDAVEINALKQASDVAARDLNYERGGQLLLAEIEKFI